MKPLKSDNNMRLITLTLITLSGFHFSKEFLLQTSVLSPRSGSCYDYQSRRYVGRTASFAATVRSTGSSRITLNQVYQSCHSQNTNIIILKKFTAAKIRKMYSFCVTNALKITEKLCKFQGQVTFDISWENESCKNAKMRFICVLLKHFKNQYFKREGF